MSRPAAKLAWNCCLDDPGYLRTLDSIALNMCMTACRSQAAKGPILENQFLDVVRFWCLCCGSMVLLTRDKMAGQRFTTAIFEMGRLKLKPSTLTQGQQARSARLFALLKVVVFSSHVRIDSLSNPRLGAGNSSASLVTESTAVASCQLSNNKRTPGCSFRVYRAWSYTVKWGL